MKGRERVSNVWIKEVRCFPNGRSDGLSVLNCQLPASRVRRIPPPNVRSASAGLLMQIGFEFGIY